MVSLIDIAPVTETVHGVAITGVSARGISYLMVRFPELRMLMSGRELITDLDKIMMLAPEAIAAIIAVGCGYVPNGKDGSAEAQQAAEDKAAGLPVGMQADLIEPIIRLTLPGGVGPFVAKLERLGEFAGGVFTKGQDTKSP